MAHEINQPLAAIRSYADNAGILIQRERLPEASEGSTEPRRRARPDRAGPRPCGRSP
jgi:C4-dicarboxylate-specific signal transduction histidine kinase